MKNQSQIAVTLFNLREYCKTEADLATTLEQLKVIGFSVVQVSAVPLDAEIIRKQLDQFEMHCCATHDSYDMIFGDVNQICDKLDILNCNYTALGAPPRMFRSHVGMKELARKFNEQGEKMLARGKKLGYHNHHFEFDRCGGDCTILDTFYNNTDPNFVQAELDVQWIARGGASPVDFIQRFKGRLDVIHFKDFTILEDRSQDWKSDPVLCEVGEGNLDWKNIVPECAKSEVKFYSIEQDAQFLNRNIFDSMKISFDNMKKFGLN